MNISERRFQLMILLCQTLGLCNINSIPSFSLTHGVIGSIIFFLLFYVLLGIPLLYMESIIGQFTGRDCVNVWKIRPFLSYTGYVLVLWQVIILIYNHTYVSFIVHYFLISFENPIPYYQCGLWSTRNCNILLSNYTVTEDCMQRHVSANYCEYIHTTFPEYQYWRNYVLRVNNNYRFYIAWRICLASGLMCIFLYLSCFKRKTSMKWVVGCIPIYPLLGFLPFMLGSMLQKGIIVKFEEALDFEFTNFTKKFRFANLIHQIIYSLGLGSGLTLNFASSTSFRSNCFSNSIISVVISSVFSVLVICTTAMMGCPYAYHHGVSMGAIIRAQMSLIFEKVPRLLAQYEDRFLWLILVFSCNVTLGLCTNVLIFYNLLEILFLRYQKICNYPGLTCFVGIILLFSITVPFLSNIGILFALSFTRYVTLTSTFFVMVECAVFINFYGVHRFSEDVHFMLGIQPSFYMKAVWSLGSALLAYTFCSELIYYYKAVPKSSIVILDLLGWNVFILICGVVVLLSAGRLLVAVCRKRFVKMLRLDPSWGPKSDILLRSRAMFSAQAMTKEYMYRQYHLQAGIISRQRKSNKRNPNKFVDQRFSV